MFGLSRGWKFVSTLSLVGTFVAAQLVSVAEESVPEAVKGAPATHKQKTIVTVVSPGSREKLEDFCIDAKGRILALLGPADANQFAVPVPDAESVKKAAPEAVSEVRVYAADGKLVEQWPVGFTGQAINTAPDGTILIGGDGKVARFSADGKRLYEAESPQMTYISKNPDDMRERAEEQLKSDRLLYADQLKQFEEQLAELKATKKDEKKPADKPKPAEGEEAVQFGEQQLEQIVNSYKSMVQNLEKKTVDQVLQEVLARAKRTHSITASDKDVFVSCPALAGYGFGVWRTDEKFGQAKEIVKSLSGCCGQMDVQCCNGELYVCENSRHRVLRFDRNGKQIAQFGKRDRTGEGENFGGCCNPMNLCFNKQGELYVSESNGVVKHFTPDGKYLGIVGIAAVQPGCKNSCVGVTADDSRLFYIDIYKSQIIVLAREDAVGENKK